MKRIFGLAPVVILTLAVCGWAEQFSEFGECETSTVCPPEISIHMSGNDPCSDVHILPGSKGWVAVRHEPSVVTVKEDFRCRWLLGGEAGLL